MTLKQNITSILECHFSGFKDELIEACVQRIMEQIERQADTPQTEREGRVMDETKVQIGDDVLLDIGTHSDWYISTICYNNESVNVELCRKTDCNNKWWIAEQTKPQTERSE